MKSRYKVLIASFFILLEAGCGSDPAVDTSRKGPPPSNANDILPPAAKAALDAKSGNLGTAAPPSATK